MGHFLSRHLLRLNSEHGTQIANSGAKGLEALEDRGISPGNVSGVNVTVASMVFEVQHCP